MKKGTKLNAFGLAVVFSVGLIACEAQAVYYDVTRVGAAPLAINNAGEMTGINRNSWSPAIGPDIRAFYRNNDGIIYDLDNPPVYSYGFYSSGFDKFQGNDINENRWIAGESDPKPAQHGDLNNHAFLLTGNGYFDINYFLGVNPASGDSSAATGINDLGQVVGNRTYWGYNTQAFLFDYNSQTVTSLGGLGGGPSQATGINNSGQVVGRSAFSTGERAFIYSNGVMSDLGTLGGNFSHAKDINDSSQVVGNSRNASNQTRAFLYSEGVMQDLGTLGGMFSQAETLNSSGQVVGSADNASNERRAFLYSDGVMTDLNTLIYSIPDEFEETGGLTLRNAFGINDNGLIIASAEDSFGNRWGVLLTPSATSEVPVPGAAWLLGSGLLGLAGLGRRKKAAVA